MDLDYLTKQALREAPTVDELAGVVADLVNIRSEAGSESGVARYLRDCLARRGFNARLQEVEQGRHNVIGVLDTGRPGPSLMFMGHMDTSTHHRVDGPPGMRSQATLENGWVYGLGASNMKSAFAGCNWSGSRRGALIGGRGW